MSAKFTIEGSGSGAVQAIRDLQAAFEATEKEADGAVRASKRLEDQAKRIVEAVNPQERYNRQIKDLAGHVHAGRIGIENAKLAAEKYGRELERAGQAGDKSFGGAFVSKLAGVATGYLSISSAVGAVTRALREQEDQAQAAADRAFRARQGLGSLSQLAAASKDPAAEFQRLVAEARGFVSSGAAADDNEAGALLFDLASAGLGARDRAFAAQVRASGTLQNVGGAARAYDALKTALGDREVGGFREFLSKALQAASLAPGSFEQLPIAVAQAGGSAKELGVSDEFLLAAGAILAKTTGDPSQGGTQLEAFLKQAEKSGLKGITGIGGVALVERIAALPASKQGFGGVLGDRAEAIAGFRTLSRPENLAALKALEADIAAAQASDLAGRAAALTALDPQLRSSIGRARAEGDLQKISQEQDAERENLFETVVARRQALLRSQGAGAMRLFFERSLSGAWDLMNWENEELDVLAGNPSKQAASGLSQRDLADIRDYARRNAESSERIERLQRSKATTRQE